ncbi:MAG: hypothetical protein ACKVP0_08405 [Pirellulaceae bacterium]
METLLDDEQRSEQDWLSAEQRRAPRHTYNGRQLVAPFDGVRLPRQDEFDWAMFNDVSETGISFLSESKPATKQLVVAVGPAPFSFLIVDVVRVTRRDDLEGDPLHIGCTIVRELTD